jgi:hypothetical protein
VADLPPRVCVRANCTNSEALPRMILASFVAVRRRSHERRRLAYEEADHQLTDMGHYVVFIRPPSIHRHRRAQRRRRPIPTTIHPVSRAANTAAACRGDKSATIGAIVVGPSDPAPAASKTITMRWDRPKSRRVRRCRRPGRAWGIATGSWRLLLQLRPTDVGRPAGVRAAFFMYLCAGENHPNNDFFLFFVLVADLAAVGAYPTSAPWK